MFFDNESSAQCVVFRKNHSIAYFTIVRDMAIGQKVSMVADSSHVSFSSCPADSDEFSEDILISNLQMSRFTDVLEILALLANGTIRKETVSCPDLGKSAKSDVILQRTSLAQQHRRPNHTRRPNRYDVATLSVGINDRRRVNVHCAT